MDDEETLSFIRRQSINAKYTFSVCTGALILGAAGYGGKWLIGRQTEAAR